MEGSLQRRFNQVRKHYMLGISKMQTAVNEDYIMHIVLKEDMCWIIIEETNKHQN